MSGALGVSWRTRRLGGSVSATSANFWRIGVGRSGTRTLPEELLDRPERRLRLLERERVARGGDLRDLRARDRGGDRGAVRVRAGDVLVAGEDEGRDLQLAEPLEQPLAPDPRGDAAADRRAAHRLDLRLPGGHVVGV